MQVSKSTLISAFATGKFPTGTDFENLIDSTYTDGSTSASVSAVSALADGTYTDLLSTNTLIAAESHFTAATATSLDVTNISVEGTPGIDASVVVSIFPSGSATLYFTNGILTELTVL